MDRGDGIPKSNFPDTLDLLQNHLHPGSCCFPHDPLSVQHSDRTLRGVRWVGGTDSSFEELRRRDVVADVASAVIRLGWFQPASSPASDDVTVAPPSLDVVRVPSVQRCQVDDLQRDGVTVPGVHLLADLAPLQLPVQHQLFGATDFCTDWRDSRLVGLSDPHICVVEASSYLLDAHSAVLFKPKETMVKPRLQRNVPFLAHVEQLVAKRNLPIRDIS